MALSTVHSLFASGWALAGGAAEVDLNPEFDTLYGGFVKSEKPSIREAYPVSAPAEIVQIYPDTYTIWEKMVEGIGTELNAMTELLRPKNYSKASF